MSLRLQLLAFGLLTLALPWAGLRFVEQMEAALRSGLESSLLASAGTVATALANTELDLGAPGLHDAASTLYADPLAAEPRVDAFRDDWIFARPGVTAVNAANTLAAGFRAWIGTSGRFAYLYFEIEDDDLVYQTVPDGSLYGDRVVLLVAGERQPQQALLLSTAAPGTFRARTTRPGAFVPDARYEDRVLAAWRETADGYALEARVPLGLTDAALGFGVIDVDRRRDTPAVTLVSTWGEGPVVPRRLVFERPGLVTILDRFSRPGERYRVLSPDGWVLADSGALRSAVPVDRGPVSLDEQFFRLLLRRNDPLYDGLESPSGRLGDPILQGALGGEPVTAWYRQGPESAAIVAAAVPVEHSSGALGAVLLEQVSDSVLTLTNQALRRLMLFTVLVSVVAAAGLLAYATLLSFRVGRLARAAETALGPRGEIKTVLPGGSARDEIGDLARSFQSLLGRLREYTEYLRTLSAKLAHELRTPLAIVSTSLDNLEHEKRDDSTDAYLERLRQGTERLESILSAMSAATRVEQSVGDTPAEIFDAGAVVDACVTAYRDVYADRKFTCAVPAAPSRVLGSADLLAQLMDKLVENAVGFSEPASTIDVTLAATPDRFDLSVANTGPALPEAMRHQLFDSLVSVRAAGDGRGHLGLGLYIVSLIARFHGGSVTAENLADGSGVAVIVQLPRVGS